MKRCIITIDGPAGAGKTTLARKLAQTLGLPYMDTGAMFRFLALRLGANAAKMDEEQLKQAASQFKFSLDGIGDDTRLLVNGEAPGDEIRTNEVSALASTLATRPEIRAVLRQAQRQLGETSSLVAEGRDLGTVVFPEAQYKFFLDASPEERAKRRCEQLRERGMAADLAEISAGIRKRDQQDATRAEAPLKAAADAVIIDTSQLSIADVLDKMLARIAGDAICRQQRQAK